jgi:hypothetical protein
VVGAGYGQINEVNATGLVQPFASASLSLPAGLNFEAYGSPPIGTGGNLSDPSATGTLLSFRLGAGIGVQIQFGDYAIGAEIGSISVSPRKTLLGFERENAGSGGIRLAPRVFSRADVLPSHPDRNGRA